MERPIDDHGHSGAVVFRGSGLLVQLNRSPEVSNDRGPVFRWKRLLLYVSIRIAIGTIESRGGPSVMI